MTIINLGRFIEDDGWEAISIGQIDEWRAIDNEGRRFKERSSPELGQNDRPRRGRTPAAEGHALCRRPRASEMARSNVNGLVTWGAQWLASIAVLVCPPMLGESAMAEGESSCQFGDYSSVLAVSEDYSVSVNGEDVPAYRFDPRQDANRVDFAWFNVPERSDIRVSTRQAIRTHELAPISYGIAPEVDGNSLSFNASGRHYFHVTANGISLALSAGAPEPMPYKHGEIENVKMSLMALKGQGSRNIVVQDLLVLESTEWAITFFDCDNTRVANAKVIKYVDWYWSDGVHFTSCRKALAEDCYAYCGDDAYVATTRVANAPTRDVTFRNNVAGFTTCTGLRAGWYARDIMDGVLFESNVIVSAGRGIDVLHYGYNGKPIKNVVFKNTIVEEINEWTRDVVFE